MAMGGRFRADVDLDKIVVGRHDPALPPAEGQRASDRPGGTVPSLGISLPRQYWPDIVKRSPSIGLEDSSDFRDQILSGLD